MKPLTPEEFKNWVQEETDFSVYDCADYDANNGDCIVDFESIFEIAQAYTKHFIENAVSDEEIENTNNGYRLSKSYLRGFTRGVYWHKQQLKNKLK